MSIFTNVSSLLYSTYNLCIEQFYCGNYCVCNVAVIEVFVFNFLLNKYVFVAVKPYPSLSSKPFYISADSWPRCNSSERK